LDSSRRGRRVWKPGTDLAKHTAFLAGDTDALAAASLQETLTALAARSDARLESSEALPAEQADTYRRISVRVTLHASFPSLVALLRTITTASPSLLVDDLHLRTVDTQPQGATAATELDATFTVLGFRATSRRQPAQGAP